MAYSTLADLIEQIDETKLVQLTDDDNTGAVDADRVSRAIADADEEIDGYVGSRYPVPVSPVPAILRKFSVDIAIYNLYARRDKAPDGRVDRYKNAIRFLEQVASGKISLGADDPGGTPPAANAPEFSADNPERIFTRDGMTGF